MSAEVDVPATLRATFDKALIDHGDDAVQLALTTFFLPVLPLAVAMAEAQAVNKLADSLGLDGDQMVDALGLFSALRRADNPHGAWIAAEIMLRTMPAGGREALLASLASLQTPETNTGGGDGSPN